MEKNKKNMGTCSVTDSTGCTPCEERFQKNIDNLVKNGDTDNSPKNHDLKQRELEDAFRNDTTRRNSSDLNNTPDYTVFYEVDIELGDDDIQ